MLLADFHIHTTWSDGHLSLPEVIDLFGRSGHDVIAITDHVVNTDRIVGQVTHRFGLSLTARNFDAYLSELEREGRRAREQYGMLVIPGVELTQNNITRRNSAHALALGVDRFLSADGTVEEMLTRAQDSGAVVVACHPNEMSDWYANTFYLWNERRDIGQLIHLWELACRWDLFPPVARARLPYVGNSDFHKLPHLYAWKTLLPARKTERDVIAALKRGEGLAVTRLAPPTFIHPEIHQPLGAAEMAVC